MMSQSHNCGKHGSRVELIYFLRLHLSAQFTYAARALAILPCSRSGGWLSLEEEYGVAGSAVLSPHTRLLH